MVTKNMENSLTTPNNSTNLSSSAKRFRFDSFAMEFACKEKDISPVSLTQSLSSSSHSINQTTDHDIVDNDSGIGKFFIYQILMLWIMHVNDNQNSLIANS